MKPELMITSAHPVLEIPATLSLPVNGHWPTHLVLTTVHTGLTWSPKTKVNLSPAPKIQQALPILRDIKALALQWPMLCMAKIFTTMVQMGTPRTPVTRFAANFREQRTAPPGSQHSITVKGITSAGETSLSEASPSSLPKLDWRYRCEMRIWKALEAHSHVTACSGVPNNKANCSFIFKVNVNSQDTYKLTRVLCFGCSCWDASLNPNQLNQTELYQSIALNQNFIIPHPEVGNDTWGQLFLKKSLCLITGCFKGTQNSYNYRHAMRFHGTECIALFLPSPSKPPLLEIQDAWGMGLVRAEDGIAHVCTRGKATEWVAR